MALGTKIRVDDLDETKPIYVKNKSNGDFLLTIHLPSGGTELVPIPKTYIPVEITGMCEPSLFKRSSDFRKSLTKGLIEIISEEDALAILDTPEGRQELERIRVQTSGVAFDSAVHQTSPLEATAATPQVEVSDIVRDIIIRTDIQDDEKIRLIDIEHKLGNITQEDLEYITLTIESKSKLYKWAAKILDQKNLFGKKEGNSDKKGDNTW